jgi:cell division protein ZapA (FtsZ GTPase activity inhibitor)
MSEMISIKVNLLGKSYSLRVIPSDEPMMYEIVDYVNQRFSEFRKELQGQPEATVSALATLSIAEDLFIERRKPKVQESDNSVIEGRLYKLLTTIQSANSDI